MNQNQHYVLSGGMNYSYLQSNIHIQNSGHLHSNNLHLQTNPTHFQNTINHVHKNNNHIQNSNSQLHNNNSHLQNQQPSKILASNYLINSSQQNYPLVYSQVDSNRNKTNRIVNQNTSSPYMSQQIEGQYKPMVHLNVDQQRIVTNSMVHLNNNSIRPSSINNIHLSNKASNLKSKQNSSISINHHKLSYKQSHNHEYIDNLISNKLGSQQCLENRIQNQIKKIQTICQSQNYKLSDSQPQHVILKNQNQRIESIMNSQQSKQTSQINPYCIRNNENYMLLNTNIQYTNQQNNPLSQQNHTTNQEQFKQSAQVSSRSQSNDSAQQNEIMKGNTLAQQRSKTQRNGFFCADDSNGSIEITEDSLFSLDDCKLVVKRDIPHFQILNENNMLFNRNKLNHNQSEKKRNGYLDQLQNCLVFLNVHK